MSIRMSPRLTATVLIIMCTAGIALSGCAWKPYVITRAVRYGTGQRTRFHAIVPIAASLRSYRVIEFSRLENLLPARVPAPTEKYINDRITRELRSIRTSPRVVAAADDETAEPTLVIDGYVDDFDGGSLPLRIVELGFNHIAVTIRVRLRDKQSTRVVGAASITTEDNRATGTPTGAIDHIAKRIRSFVDAGYAP